jgi:hypothetical protein
MSRAEVSRIKAFLTRTTDRFRPPHGRDSAAIGAEPARCTRGLRAWRGSAGAAAYRAAGRMTQTRSPPVSASSRTRRPR